MNLDNINIRKAVLQDFDDVMALYDEIIDRTKGDINSPRWTRGMYPTDEMIRDDIQNGGLFVGEYDGRIISSMVVNHEYNDGYDDINWLTDLDNSKIYYIHLVGVNPDYFRMGIADKMMSYVVSMAKEEGVKSLRLDVIDGNMPAENLYRGIGFQYVETGKLFYEDTGWMNFRLFEYIL